MRRARSAGWLTGGVRTSAGVAALGVLGVGGLGGCGDESVSLPDVQLVRLNDEGTSLDVGALAGPAVINVWATWCQPCVAELPEFQAVSAEYPSVRFIGVDATGVDDDPESVRFLADLEVTYEQFADPDGEFSAGLEITELPTTVVVGADGEVALLHQGRLTRDELVRELADL